jgi:hypothetical protein
MYVNAKIIPVETVPGMRSVKDNSGGGWIRKESGTVLIQQVWGPELNKTLVLLKLLKNPPKCL